MQRLKHKILLERTHRIDLPDVECLSLGPAFDMRATDEQARSTVKTNPCFRGDETGEEPYWLSSTHNSPKYLE